jgi:hypothetical protein
MVKIAEFVIDAVIEKSTLMRQRSAAGSKPDSNDEKCREKGGEGAETGARLAGLG